MSAYTHRRTPMGYVVEGAAPLAESNVAPGGPLGLLVMVADVDNTPNLKHGDNWARKQSLLYPHKPSSPFWRNVRNRGKLVLGK